MWLGTTRPVIRPRTRTATMFSFPIPSTAVPGGGDQFNQWLAVDPSNGSVNVAYYDTGTHGATSTLYTLARSTDGGSNFTASAVANAATDESCCVPSVNLGNQYGDYEG